MQLGIGLVLGAAFYGDAGTIVDTEDPDTLVAAGTVGNYGTVASTEAGDTSASSGLSLPGDLPTLTSWYRADTSFSGAQWDDKSGNGHHLLQATGTNQPSALAGAQNGQPAARYDGINDFQKASYIQGAPCTVFFVYRQNSFTGSGAHDIIYDGASAGSDFVLCSNTVNQKFRVNAAMAYDTQVANGVFAYTTVVFAVAGVARVNGVQIGTGSWAGTPSGFTVGALGDGSRNTQIDVLEILVLNSIATATEISHVENYFQLRYAL